MELKWRVPEVCHVNGPSWFSGGTSLTRLGQYVRIVHMTYVRIGLLYNMSLHTVQYVFAFCEMRLCVLCKCLALFALVSHAGQWPICQRERAIDRIFAPRSLSKWGAQKTSPTLVICQNTSLFPHFLFSRPGRSLPALGDWKTNSLTSNLEFECRKQSNTLFREHGTMQNIKMTLFRIKQLWLKIVHYFLMIF